MTMRLEERKKINFSAKKPVNKCHIGQGFLKVFLNILSNSERKICGKVIQLYDTLLHTNLT